MSSIRRENSPKAFHLAKTGVSVATRLLRDGCWTLTNSQRSKEFRLVEVDPEQNLGDAAAQRLGGFSISFDPTGML